MEFVSYRTLSPLEKNSKKQFIATRDHFSVFIDPVFDSPNIPAHFKTSRFAYIPRYGKNHQIVYLQHNTIYKIGISNHSDHSANCQIIIDGKSIGVFRVPKQSSHFRLERPLDHHQAFTFISSNSDIAKQAGIPSSHCSGTSITIFIRPEDPSFNYKSYIGFRGQACETDHSSDMSLYNTMHNSVRGGFNSIKFKRTKGMPYPAKSINKPDTAKSINKPDDDDDIDSDQKGITILGKTNNQAFSKASHIITKGEFQFKLNLSLGDPSKNSLYYIDQNKLK